MKKILALAVALPLLAGCVPTLIPFHYALDDGADKFYRGLWEKTGLCIVYPDGSTANCE